MKAKAAELTKAYENLSGEAKESVGRLHKFIEKRAMSAEAVAELIDTTLLGADNDYPELKEVEGMTGKQFSEMYRKMSEDFAFEPEKYEEHVKAAGMSPDDLTILFAQINGVIEKYPEVWESQENAQMLSPRNLAILLDVFKKQK